MSEAPQLPRLTEQIIRNNIARTLNASQDIEGHLKWGLDEYFEKWGDGAFPWVDGGTLTLQPNTAISADEREALLPLVDTLNSAWNACDGASVAAFLASSWPAKIKRLSADAYTVMSTRGSFSETFEEQEPSSTF